MCYGSLSNTRSGQTEPDCYEHMEHCQSWVEVSPPVSFSPLTGRGSKTPRYPLSNCPWGQILHWSNMNQAVRAVEHFSDRDCGRADRDTEHTAWHADSQSPYRNIRSWQIGLGGGGGGGRRPGRLTAHVKFIVSHGLGGNTSPLRDVSEK